MRILWDIGITHAWLAGVVFENIFNNSDFRKQCTDENTL
jgi:hypothetical protein